MKDGQSGLRPFHYPTVLWRIYGQRCEKKAGFAVRTGRQSEEKAQRRLLTFHAIASSHCKGNRVPNYRRSNTAGATYFFTVTTMRRQPVLTEEPFRNALRDAIRQIQATHPFDIDAWVLLPDHLHCLWTLPEGDAGFALRWSKIKRLVSQQCGIHANGASSASRTMRRESSLWQRRFWEHQIRDDCDFERHADYIHWNPVKHGLAERAADWPYSTFHRFVRNGAYAADWGLADQHSAEGIGGE